MLSAAAAPFFFIRHGETSWNREGRLQGQRDVPLNPVGRDQAAAAGRMLKRVLAQHGIEDASALTFVASPLGRARMTMEIARTAMGLDPLAYSLDDRLRELGFGAWEGLTWSEAKGRVPALVKARKRDKWNFVPPGGESYAQLGERLAGWVPTIGRHHVVVAHGGVARVLMAMLADVPVAAAPDVHVWQGRVLTFKPGACHWD